MTTVQRSHRPNNTTSVTATPISRPTSPVASAQINAAAHSDADAFSRVDDSNVVLPQAQESGSAAHCSPVAAFAAHQSQGRARLSADLEALDVKLDVAARAVPRLAEQAVHSALSRSSQRVLKAYDTGRIDLDEAKRAQHMLSEMIGALTAIESGNYNIISIDDPGAHGMSVYDVTTTENDTIRVSVRSQGSSAGEARFKMTNTMDNGEPVSAERRMMVRFDLEGSGIAASEQKASIDVQIGHDRPSVDAMALDKRVHGVLLDENGQPKLNRGGRTIADHHFSQGLPDSLNNADAFGQFVSTFLDNLLNHPGEDT